MMCVFSFHAQQSREVDSLMVLIKKSSEDSVKAKLYYKVALWQKSDNPLEAMKAAREVLRLSNPEYQSRIKIKSYNILGDLYFSQARYDKSFQNYYFAYQLSDSIKDQRLLANSSYNLGWVAAIQKENMEDVHYLYQALKIGELINDKIIVLKVDNALGSFYTNKYQKQKEKSDFDSAIKYFNSGIELSNKLKMNSSIGIYYINIGELQLQANDINSAKFYFEKGKELLKSDSGHVMGVMHRLAACESRLGHNPEALDKLLSVYKYASSHDEKELRKETVKDLADIYHNLGENDKAFEYLKEYHRLKSGIDDEFHTMSVKNLETSYNYDRIQNEVTQLHQANEIQELKNKRKSVYIYLLIIVAAAISVFLFQLYRQNRLKQMTNLQLKNQNKIIVEKKNEIEQSIHYAQGIQTTFLPDRSMMEKHIPEHFIFYQPKDVVSGDFYWFKTNKENSEILIACADCTGHGVPGALMSMVGINMLQQLSGNETLHHPSTILRQLNNEIKNALKQTISDNKQRDGMDIALLKIDLKKRKAYYAGANRPVYIVSNGQLLELKPDKSSIGGYTEMDCQFKEHEHQIRDNEFFVMTTDGFVDQFGMDAGTGKVRKFMTRRFKELITSISDNSSKEQFRRIQSEFRNWKGTQEQVDDICVIGFKIS